MPLKGTIRVITRACLSTKRPSGADKTAIKSATTHLMRVASRSFSTTGSLEMRFVQFVNKNGGPQHLGVQLQPGGDITDISAVDSRIPNNLKKFLEGGEDLLKNVKRNESLMETVKRIVVEGRSIVQEADVNFLPPVTRMDKLACVGLNYSGHCKEQGLEPPKSPVMFSKFPSNIVGPNDDVVLPSISDKVDWEVELAIVIGKKGKALNNHEAEDYIFGYTIAQDLSARDWQKGSRNGGQFLLGKAMDNFCPLGPAVVTKEAICDINNLSVKTWVNGQLKQDGNTSELIFKPHDIVAYLSQFVTLLPGDVILTGTPGGVGFARNPPEYLKKGDILESEIESLGRMRNTMV
ncbi:fumarylacetoacetate hydrolase domain-containing protein 2A isoform X1 [Neodiprion lecontei]|uniref:Fumarylacetoacetate hydrolase domain-containing protein 2A isoform X1 n=1 Tax=Neodiprion lecontei TaxID=441921 RepID=A0ABM3G165_NEOLC|nr:fumarylacetoacetate hydrolase domain-containing protein 2A isoform X1 [Neodiprion lecontei]